MTQLLDLVPNWGRIVFKCKLFICFPCSDLIWFFLEQDLLDYHFVRALTKSLLFDILYIIDTTFKAHVVYLIMFALMMWLGLVEH